MKTYIFIIFTWYSSLAQTLPNMINLSDTQLKMNAPMDSGDKYITLKNKGGIEDLRYLRQFII